MKKLLALALIATPFAAFASSNLLTNGSFESDAIGNGSWAISSGLTGWSAAADGIELRNNVEGAAQQGVNYVELDTTANSSISQTVNTVAGEWYALSFNYSNRTNTAVQTNGLNWSFGNTVSSAPTLAFTNSGHQWSQVDALVQATGSSMTLSFMATGNSDGYGTSLDNVALTTAAVPEPQTYALMVAGLMVMGFISRRRKQA